MKTYGTEKTVVHKKMQKQRFNADTVLCHNPMMAVTPGISPAGNQCS